jgi:predicted membrane chloride channel (bestrophin family)
MTLDVFGALKSVKLNKYLKKRKIWGKLLFVMRHTLRALAGVVSQESKKAIYIQNVCLLTTS